jgi:hypothetical protein
LLSNGDASVLEWQRDQRHAAQVRARHWTALRDRLGFPGGVLFDIEGRDERVANMLDRDSGLDVSVKMPGGARYMVSWRVQYAPNLWASHTERYLRRSGARTESAKDRLALLTDSTRSKYKVQMYVDGTCEWDGDDCRTDHARCLGAMRVRTDDIATWLDLDSKTYSIEKEHAFCGLRKVRDGNWMQVIWWDWLREAGVSLTGFEGWQLRTPRRPHHPAECGRERCDSCDAYLYSAMRYQYIQTISDQPFGPWPSAAAVLRSEHAHRVLNSHLTIPSSADSGAGIP